MTAMPDALQDALKLLPHGPEFRFVDRLVSMVPGKEGVGEYGVRGDEFYLRGHLPGEPLFPGVLLVEAAAQLAGVVAQNDPVIPSLPGLKLTALRAVKILGTARPGETVRMAASITARLGPLVQAKVSASVGRVEVMTAELTLSGTAPAEPAGAQKSGHDKLVPHREKA
jgi:3-hydroxyacyl-[acyl-carrier-protein] dehydratase